MSSRPTVAIAGATGNLGAKIAAGFLTPPFRAAFRDVIVLARSRSANAETLTMPSTAKWSSIRPFSLC